MILDWSAQGKWVAVLGQGRDHEGQRRRESRVESQFSTLRNTAGTTGGLPWTGLGNPSVKVSQVNEGQEGVVEPGVRAGGCRRQSRARVRPGARG